MGVAIPIETSARHIHMCRNDFEALFGEGSELTYKADLSQPGQFVAKERLSVRGPKGSFENVAILGPFRKETQLEISMTDSRKLGVPGIIRQSGDTKDTPGCTLIGPKGSIELDHGVIVAKRHIHMSSSASVPNLRLPCMWIRTKPMHLPMRIIPPALFSNSSEAEPITFRNGLRNCKAASIGYSFAVSVFALTPSSMPSFPDRELVASPGASSTTLIMETPRSL